MSNAYLHSELTEAVIGCCYNVHNELGSGFLEKVYQNALAIELKEAGIVFEQEYGLNVLYHGSVVGEYIPDFIIDRRIIVELKAVQAITKTHEVQLVNYLKATGLKVGLLINFGDSVQVKRRILS